MSGGTANHCVLTGNIADNWAGGMFRGVANNCVITGNSARSGGGTDDTTANNCTIIGNIASVKGGGMYRGTANNCILWFNQSPDGPDLRFTTTRYSCSPDVTHGVDGNITNTPVFVDWMNGDYRLAPNSPCIDAGNNDFVETLTDLDANPRILNGIVDMGAYEFIPLSPADRVQQLMDLVNASDLHRKQLLLATLQAALTSLERNHGRSAVGQLHAFQNKVRAQVASHDPALALQLVNGAQQAMDERDDTPGMAGRILSLKRHPNGRMQLQIKGQAAASYILEGSTNLVDWTPISVVRPDEEGNRCYEDLRSDNQPRRFYRVVRP